MTLTADDLYARGTATLLASWEEYARGRPGAALERLRGVAVAVFRDEPERAVYNNAVLGRDLGPGARAAAVDAMESAYGAAGVDRYAAWVHESDAAMRAELASRGYVVEESTRAMGMSLDDIAIPRPEADLGRADLAEHLRIIGVPAGLLRGADTGAFRILVARLGGEDVASALGFDHDGDRGVFNVGTLESARRRGSAPRSPPTWSTTPPSTAAPPRACSPRRWPSGCTRRSDSATSAASWSSCRAPVGAARDHGAASGDHRPAALHSDQLTIPSSGRGVSSSSVRYSSRCPSGSRK